MKQEYILEDIDYVIHMESKEDERIEPCSVSFEVYEIECYEVPSNIPTIKKRVYLSGDIRWDGCSNMYFNRQDEVMLHFCGKQEAMNIGVLMGYLYEKALEFMPSRTSYLE